MIGQRFGRLVVTAQAPTVHYTRWRCRCDCGGEVVVSRKLLTAGPHGRRSCGCLRREVARINGGIRHAPPVSSPCALADVWR